MALAGRIIVYGGKGALGTVIVNAFKAKNYVCNIFNLSDIIDGVVMLYFLIEWLELNSTQRKLDPSRFGHMRLFIFLFLVNAFKAKNYVCNIFNLSDIIDGVVMLFFILEWLELNSTQRKLDPSRFGHMRLFIFLFLVNAFKAKNYVCNIFNLSDIIDGVVMFYILL